VLYLRGWSCGEHEPLVVLFLSTSTVQLQYYYFNKHSTNVDIHTYTITHPYQRIHAHPTPISISKRLSRLDFDIHEVDHQERLTVDGDNASH
jgi:hypothetical protein